MKLLLNSLGEPEDRARYVDALQRLLRVEPRRRCRPRARSRSTRTRCACSIRSDPSDAAIIAAAPRIAEFYSADAAAHFDGVQAGLAALGIPFTIDDTLVRGLDYYRHTTFEFQGGTFDSAQNALGGGGRYDGLVESLGGPPTHGIGFALGLDRTLLACDDEGVFAGATAGARRVRRRHHRWARGAATHRRAARRRTDGRPGLREPQHEGADEGRRPQRRRLRRSSSAATKLAEGAVTVRPLRTDDGQQTIARSTLIDYLKKARS